jgi:hypothetical protein
MNKPIQVPCRLLYSLPHFIITIQIENISNEVKGILIVLDFGIKTRQIEPVSEVVFVDLAKVLVAPGRDELRTKVLAYSQKQ